MDGLATIRLGKLDVMNLSRQAGKRYLVGQGFVTCANPHYYTKGNTCACFNKIINGWVVYGKESGQGEERGA